MTSATMRAPVRHSSLFFLRSNGIRARSLPGYTLVIIYFIYLFYLFILFIYFASPLAIGSHAGYILLTPLLQLVLTLGILSPLLRLAGTRRCWRRCPRRRRRWRSCRSRLWTTRRRRPLARPPRARRARRGRTRTTRRRAPCPASGARRRSGGAGPARAPSRGGRPPTGRPKSRIDKSMPECREKVQLGLTWGGGKDTD